MAFLKSSWGENPRDYRSFVIELPLPEVKYLGMYYYKGNKNSVRNKAHPYVIITTRLEEGFTFPASYYRIINTKPGS